MKKEIPIPLVVGLIVIGLAVAAFFLFRAGNTQEFPAPPAAKTIPRHIYDSLPPQAQAKVKADGIEVVEGGDSQPQGTPGYTPGGPGSPAPAAGGN